MTVTARVAASLPAPRSVTLGDRGTTAVWDTQTTSTTRTPALLLHGWNVDARLNFESTVPALSDGRRVVMFDQHGHGKGVRTDSVFELERCADDAVAVLDALDIDDAIIVGYSLGGAVAQLMARARPDRCTGLVLAATADRYLETRWERTQFSVLDTGARNMRRLPTRAQKMALRRISAVACRRYPPWVLDTVRTADPVALLEAGAALGRFDSTSWAQTISRPSAMVVTAEDTVVPPHRQRRLADLIDAADVVEIDADHDVPIRNDPRFADALVAAVAVVEEHASRT